jgi:hypothetical protein
MVWECASTVGGTVGSPLGTGVGAVEETERGVDDGTALVKTLPGKPGVEPPPEQAASAMASRVIAKQRRESRTGWSFAWAWG